MVKEVNGVKSYTFGPQGVSINNNERYVFKRDWGYGNLEVKAGNQVSITHGCVYYNGGLISSELQPVFMNLIQNEKRNGFVFLRPDMPVYNKC